MLTKGIIVNKLVDDNHYMIRIPLLENASDLEDSSVEAILAYTAGVVESFKPGDVVMVGFEEHSPDSPVIIGKLFLPEDINESRGFANFESLNVSKSVSLPDDTTIGGQSLKNLPNLLDYLLSKESSGDSPTPPTPVTGDAPVLGIIKDTLTNINGWTLSSYESTETTIGGYPCYKITYGGHVLTELKAKNYLESMCGSEFLPTYNYNLPKNTYLLTFDGLILKPQFDYNNGLVLYKMSYIATRTWVEDQNYLTSTDLSNYVTYTGATSDIDLNGHDLSTEGDITGSSLVGDGLYIGDDLYLYQTNHHDYEIGDSGIVLTFNVNSLMYGNYEVATLHDIPDVSGYVPYSGASGNVDLGVNALSADTLNANELNIGDLTIESTGANQYSINADSSGIIDIYGSQLNFNNDAVLTSSNLTGFVPYQGANGNVIPLYTNSIDLGSSAKNFKDVYARRIYSSNSLTLYSDEYDINVTTDDGDIKLDADWIKIKTTNKWAILDADSLTDDRTFVFPNRNGGGTFAMEEDLGDAASKDYTSSVTQGSTDLVTSGAVWSAIDALPDGTVTSVAIRNGSSNQGTLVISGSPITSEGTIDITLDTAYGDTKNPYGTKTKNYVLASPNGSSGEPGFRALVADDIPDLSSTYVATNQAITGATKCKITYDSKGLVTAGADLSASDIPDLSGTYVDKTSVQTITARKTFQVSNVSTNPAITIEKVLTDPAYRRADFKFNSSGDIIDNFRIDAYYSNGSSDITQLKSKHKILNFNETELSVGAHTYTITLPDDTGTVALTKNVVPYSGATNDLNLGNHGLSTSSINIDGLTISEVNTGDYQIGVNNLDTINIVAGTLSYNGSEIATASDIPDISHMVTDNESQVITGKKTFRVANSSAGPAFDIEKVMTSPESRGVDFKYSSSLEASGNFTIDAYYSNNDSDISKLKSKHKILNFNETESNVAAHTYTLTLPDETGTLATTSHVASKYLPLSAGILKPLTGILVLNNGTDSLGSIITTGQMTIKPSNNQKLLLSTNGGNIDLTASNNGSISLLSSGDMTLGATNYKLYQSSDTSTAKYISLSVPTLTDNISISLPNAAGTLALTGDITTALANYVTLDTSQTITGIKTYRANSNGQVFGIERILTEPAYRGVDFEYNSSNVTTGVFQIDAYYSNGSSDITQLVSRHKILKFNEFGLLPSSSGTFTVTMPDDSGTIALTKNVVPYTGATGDVTLGTHGLTVGNINIDGLTISEVNSGDYQVGVNSADSINFSANALTFNGDDILTSTNISSYLSDFVTLDTTQTITGRKTFNITSQPLGLTKTLESPAYKGVDFKYGGSGLEQFRIDAYYSNGSSSLTTLVDRHKILDFGEYGLVSGNYVLTLPDENGTLATQTWALAKSGASNMTNAFNVSTKSTTSGTYGIELKTIGQGVATPGNITLNSGNNLNLTVKNALNIHTNIVDSNDTYYGTFVVGGLTANRTYTFPDATGTIALTGDFANYVKLSDSQTITGFKTFEVPMGRSGAFFINRPQDDPATRGVDFEYTTTNILNGSFQIDAYYNNGSSDITQVKSKHKILRFNEGNSLMEVGSNTYTLTLPDLTGTLITQEWVQNQNYLTSASLENFVTLNTTQTITAKKTLKLGSLSTDAALTITKEMESPSYRDVDFKYGGNLVDNFRIDAYYTNGSSDITQLITRHKILDFNETGLSASSSGTYTISLPDDTGTIALTKNLNNYLPLSAGSNKPLTGDLYVKETTNNNTVNLSVNSSGNATLATSAGDIILSPYSDCVRVLGSLKIFSGNNSNLSGTFDASNLSTNSRTYYLPNATGTLSLEKYRHNITVNIGIGPSCIVTFSLITTSNTSFSTGILDDDHATKVAALWTALRAISTGTSTMIPAGGIYATYTANIGASLMQIIGVYGHATSPKLVIKYATLISTTINSSTGDYDATIRGSIDTSTTDIDMAVSSVVDVIETC